MRDKYYKNEYIEMWIENGIIHAVYAPSVQITLEAAQMNVLARRNLTERKTYPAFVDTRKAMTMTKEARNYLSEGESIKGLSAGAFLINTKIQAFIINTWLTIYKPPVPAKLFTEKKAALEWLEQFKRIN